MPRPPSQKELVRWGEALSAIARTGLGFTESLYERERFEEILKVAAEIRVAADSHDEGESAQKADTAAERHDGGGLRDRGGSDRADALVQEWMGSIGQGVAGYVTPKLAVGAVVGNDRNELLLVKRADSGIWLYPTGWADVGYSAAEVVVKEVKEETGMDVEPVRLIAVLDGLRLGFTRVPLYSLIFQCRLLGGDLRAHPLECSDVGWFAEDELPFPLAGADRWGLHVFTALRGDPVEVLFDRPRPSPWRMADGGARGEDD